MSTRDKQTIYEDYVNNFPFPTYKKPASFDEVDNLISHTPHKMLVFTKNNQDAVAYATRSKNFGTSGIYNIYVNPNYEQSKEGLLLHEEGHIVFGHLHSNTFNDKTFKMKVKFAWPRIRKLIEVDNTVKLSENEIQTKYIDTVSKILLNHAMDYEVNSKLFTPEEFEEHQQRFEHDYMKNALENDNISAEQYEQILQQKLADPKTKIAKGLWPEDVGFPLKLQFTQYIDLMVRDPEEFFQKIKFTENFAPNMSSGGDDNSQSSNDNSGQQNGEGQGKSSEKSKGSGKLTLSDLDKLAKEFNDMDEEAMNELMEKAEKEETASDDIDDDDSFDIEDGDSSSINYSPFGTGVKRNPIVDAKNSKELENLILKAVFNKVLLNTRQDPVYYYNRKKYNSNVMINKSREEQLWRPGNIILLVDCSGSIADNAIGAMIKCVRNIAKKCGAKSRIIWWDTALEGDYPLRRYKGPDETGGTHIDRGIKYVHKHYLKQSNDKLIIISDYADALSLWYEEAIKIKNDIVGLCWLYASGNETPEKYISYRLPEEIPVSQFIKKIPTTLVNIS